MAHNLSSSDQSTDSKADADAAVDAIEEQEPRKANDSATLGNKITIQEPNDDMSADSTDLTLDDIQTLPLDSVVLDDSDEATERQREIATLEAIVFDGVKPEQLQQNEPTSADRGAETTGEGLPFEPKVIIPPHIALHSDPKPLPKTSSNPFLPQHILDRLNEGRRNLVEEIARSGAALDASTAMLRARTKADRSQRGFAAEEAAPQHTDNSDTSPKQQIIDEIVEEYLPLLAAELRKRLREQLDSEH